MSFEHFCSIAVCLLMHHLAASFLIGKGISEIIKRTALAAVFSAIALPTTVYKTATKALDNDFQQATDRAHKAGIILADVLEKGVQGNRPTILVRIMSRVCCPQLFTVIADAWRISSCTFHRLAALLGQ